MSINMRELARRATFASAVAAAVKGAETAAKRELLAAIQADGVKTYSAEVEDDDGVGYGTVTYRKGSNTTTVQVTDEQALLLWVAKNVPERLVEVVDPEWLSRVLSYARKTGTTACADTGGAVLPGITVTESAGSPTMAVTTSAEAKERAAALVGDLTLALPTGDGISAEMVDAIAAAVTETEDHR